MKNIIKQEQELKKQAEHCLLCKKPMCKRNCPIQTPINEVIELYRNGDYEEAGQRLFENNPLSIVCGIVCPHEKQCYGHCIRGIKGEAVRFFEIETFLSNEYLRNLRLEGKEKRKEKIAIVGSGPAGIALALILGMQGYQITIFEKNQEIGGILRYGIPKFRLPREIIKLYEQRLQELGVKIRVNTLVGPVITLDKLQEDYNAVFIGTGVWNPKPLNIKGETLGNVHYAIDYLGDPEQTNLGGSVLVIGAGNVAMDSARSAKYYGAKRVTIVYRKDFEDMPATKEEIEAAKEDGVQFELFQVPVEITEQGLVCDRVQKEVDESGVLRLKPVANSSHLIPADSVIIAVSQGPKANIVSFTKNLETDRYGLLVTDESGRTTREGVFASGDVVTGAKTVVEAVANVKLVARAMEEYLEKRIQI